MSPHGLVPERLSTGLLAVNRGQWKWPIIRTLQAVKLRGFPREGPGQFRLWLAGDANWPGRR